MQTLYIQVLDPTTDRLTYVGERMFLASDDVRVTDVPLSRNHSGYGSRIPTQYLVYFKMKWRRVYVCQYANAGTAYIGRPGRWEAIIS